MAYLITADLHGDLDWFAQLKLQSRGHSATLVAGDVLNMHADQSEGSKVKPFLELSQDFEQEDKCLLFTSGNHDLDDLVLLDGLDLLGEGLAANDTEWMRFPLENDLSYVSGYETIREFEDLIVISIRWFSWAFDDLDQELRTEELCKQGFKIAQRKAKRVALLYHEPPESSYFIESLVLRFRPDFFIHGHEHEPPFQKGPVRVVADTIVLNPGQRLQCEKLSYGVLNPDQMYFEWFPNNGATSERIDLKQFT